MDTLKKSMDSLKLKFQILCEKKAHFWAGRNKNILSENLFGFSEKVFGFSEKVFGYSEKVYGYSEKVYGYSEIEISDFIIEKSAVLGWEKKKYSL